MEGCTSMQIEVNFFFFPFLFISFTYLDRFEISVFSSLYSKNKKKFLVRRLLASNLSAFLFKNHLKPFLKQSWYINTFVCNNKTVIIQTMILQGVDWLTVLQSEAIIFLLLTSSLAYFRRIPKVRVSII